jgi:hypothetical protein
MFRTFIEKTGCRPDGLGAIDNWFSRRVAQLAPRFPVWFFVWVLAGEIYIDDDNRRQLAHRHELHPLAARIMQIHVTEEARHMHFAERYLVEYMPQLALLVRVAVRASAPLILRGNARVMLVPSPSIVKRFGIPRAVLREAHGAGTAHQRRVDEITAGALELLRDRPLDAPVLS